jgi:hypothetical protein
MISGGIKMARISILSFTFLLTSAVPGIVVAAQADELSRSFEFRYFDDDPCANGQTDFKGQTALFDTEQRVEFLRQYAEYAKDFFNDPGLDTKVVGDDEVEAALKKLKPQPLPSVRERILLYDGWKWLGFKQGLTESQRRELATWQKAKGVKIEDGCLAFCDNKVKFKRQIPSQSWRFFIQWKVKVPRTDVRQFFYLSDRDSIAVTIGFNQNGRIFYRSGTKEFELEPYSAGTWYEFKIEVDLADNARRYNFYVDGQLKADYVELESCNVKQIDTFCAEGVKGTVIDNVWGVGYLRLTESPNYPYSIKTFVDEDFETGPCIEGWNKVGYDDSKWKVTSLPKVHGGERYAKQDLYLRRAVHVGDFSRAVLDVETLDPEGEIWVNGEVAAVLTDRHPARVDVTEYLKANSVNLLAVRVKHFEFKNIVKMPHTPTDVNIGWFAGRMFLDLTAKAYIDDVFVYTEDVRDPARIRTRIKVKNGGWGPLGDDANQRRPAFNGNVVVNFYPWYPQERKVAAATAKFPVTLRPWNTEVINEVVSVPAPKLWTFDNTNLYKVEVTLEDNSGKAIDDYVVTTGIRTISQDGGTFQINGKPEMLNGTQIMGFRSPLDKVATWNRCAPLEWLVKELMMIRKMNGNCMKVVVHAWQEPSRCINDPRLTEIGDQLGIMFIWSTTTWVRTGSPWAVDFDGLPKYMQQVYNHPSIIVWEIAGHPRFVDFSEANIYYERIYNTIYPVDPSRLISPLYNNVQTHFGNDLGTVDLEGKPVKASFAWTAPMVTRGNIEAVTGYGCDWSVVRNWPDAYRQELLDSKERAYFCLEHQESIGQPNWTLQKGKPSYHIHSYEWDYDEGSIGRKLSFDEWQQSQAWQGFAAYEAMRKMRILDYDGFLWCCLHGGPNTATYQKPLTDYYCHAKLAFYANRMAFQRILAGSNNVDVVYGPADVISPVIINLGEARKVKLDILVKNMDRQVVDRNAYHSIELLGGRTVTSLSEFKPAFPKKGYYAIEYCLTE